MSTCNHILEQLITEDLDVYLMFLCTFTKRDAIDNDFLDLMMHDAMKGIEPAAQGETFERKHFKQWQEKEYKWAAWQKKRKRKPLLTDPPIFNPSVIEKNPHFFSLKLEDLSHQRRG